MVLFGHLIKFKNFTAWSERTHSYSLDRSGSNKYTDSCFAQADIAGVMEQGRSVCEEEHKTSAAMDVAAAGVVCYRITQRLWVFFLLFLLLRLVSLYLLISRTSE